MYILIYTKNNQRGIKGYSKQSLALDCMERLLEEGCEVVMTTMSVLLRQGDNNVRENLLLYSA